MVAGAGLVLVSRREGGGAAEAPAHAPGATGLLCTQHQFPGRAAAGSSSRVSPRCDAAPSRATTHTPRDGIFPWGEVQSRGPSKGVSGVLCACSGRAAGAWLPGDTRGCRRPLLWGPRLAQRDAFRNESQCPPPATLRAGGPNQESPQGHSRAGAGARPCLRGHVPLRRPTQSPRQRVPRTTWLLMRNRSRDTKLPSGILFVCLFQYERM